MARHLHASAELTHQGPRVSLAMKQKIEVMAFACISHALLRLQNDDSASSALAKNSFAHARTT